MSRATRDEGDKTNETSTKALAAAVAAAGTLGQDDKPEFVPSAKPARYTGDFIPQETPDLEMVEDDHLFTEWYNPTDRDVILPIHVGTDPKNAAWKNAFLQAEPNKRREMMTGVRTFVVKARAVRQIPSEYDLAIQRTQCMHPQCGQKKDNCKDLDHPRVVISGLAPQLVCKRWHRVPAMHANLDQARAEREAAQKALADAGAKTIAAEIDAQRAREALENAAVERDAAVEARKRAEEELAKLRASHTK